MKKDGRVAGKAYAKGGPASMRDKRSKLKQAKLPELSAVSTQKHQQISGHEDADEAVKTSPDRRRRSRALATTESSDEDGRAPVTFKTTTYSSDADGSQDNPSGQQAPVKAPGTDDHERKGSTTYSPPLRKRHKDYEQSKIKFTPGGSRYISTDPIDSEEEEFRGTQFAPPVVTTRTPPKQGKRRSHKAPIVIDSDTDLESNLESDTEGRQVPSSAAKADSDEEEDEDDLITPLRRRRRFMPDAQRRGATPPVVDRRKRSRAEEAKSEARDLDNKLIKTAKHRQTNSKKSKFKSNLDRLRRKKAGLPSESEEEEEDDDSTASAAGGDGANDDWIVEDDEFDRNQLLDDLPSEFQQPRQPLEQFKIAVQWEILDLLMPQGGFAPDAYFKPAIDWLRDRTSGKFQAAISSIWRRPYVRALQRGPEINSVETGNLGAYCDACGRTNRVATYIVKFEGRRYDHLTLEDLASDADSSEDDLELDEDAASDAETERARKERILRAEWNLGVNCFERSCVAHELFHLRKHLREEVYAKLDESKLFSAAKIYERSTMTKRARIEFANTVTERLDGARFQQRLWSRYKATIERNESYIVDPAAGRKRGRYVLS